MKDNRKTHKNNHFIQKAFAKQWANNNLVKYAIWNSKCYSNVSTFDIENDTKIISGKYFYTHAIEIGMNEIESDGIKVIKQIARFATDRKIITLMRSDMVKLRFYLFLSTIRTNSLRKK